MVLRATRMWLAGLMLGFSACTSLHRDLVKADSQALPAPASPMTVHFAQEVGRHGGDSGFRLLADNTDALTARIALADHAQREIDLQTYIFHDDATGRLVAQRLLAAADRGVRVRLLIDDIDVADQEYAFAALDAHRNIEVRLFNPFLISRQHGFLSRAAQILLDGRRLNRRMHNKSFTVDSAVTIVGGRNIGDEYFDANRERNFRDLDVLAIGPVVPQVAQNFDRFWNSDEAVPVAAFHNAHVDARHLADLRGRLEHAARVFAQSDYADGLLAEAKVALPHAGHPWHWGPAQMISDVPDKASTDGDAPHFRLSPHIGNLMAGAQEELCLISPYFIPGDSGTKFLASLVQRGVRVQVLTNSLAANDEPAVHAGYTLYRKALLQGGVDLYELRPLGREPQKATDLGHSSGVSLHAKALVIDARKVFVGSLNMDPRSKLLNTEMGVIVDCPGLADEIAAFFASASDPHHSFHVTLDAAGRVTWTALQGDTPQTFTRDPDVSWWRRTEVMLLRMLPIEGLL